MNCHRHQHCIQVHTLSRSLFKFQQKQFSFNIIGYRKGLGSFHLTLVDKALQKILKGSLMFTGFLSQGGLIVIVIKIQLRAETFVAEIYAKTDKFLKTYCIQCIFEMYLSNRLFQLLNVLIFLLFMYQVIKPQALLSVP